MSTRRQKFQQQQKSKLLPSGRPANQHQQQAKVSTAAASAAAFSNGADSGQLNSFKRDLLVSGGSCNKLLSEKKKSPIVGLTRIKSSNNQNSTTASKIMDSQSQQQQQQQQQQMHVCRLCDKILSSSSSLDRHMLTHSGERPFVCKRCHMTFTTNGKFQIHFSASLFQFHSSFHSHLICVVTITQTPVDQMT